MDDPFQRFGQVDALLSAALERDPEERAAYLDEACGDDAELRATVERLLRATEDDGSDLLEPAGAMHDDLLPSAAGDIESVAPGARLGPYVIDSLLGEGGMGQVFKARDPRLRRDVALKVLDARGRGEAHVERFGREARAASALNHPNIVTIFDIGRADQVWYIAMELVDGESLRDRLLRGPLSVGETLSLARQVTEGLAVAHAQGIVHRDLKPGNIMIRTDGVPKIVDFGLAKMAPRDPDSRSPLTRTEPLTAEGLVFGTVGYMSPEQAAGRTLDYRSDLFALGAILYEMVTGTRAFDQPSDAETLAAVLKEDPAPIASLNADVPAPLQWAVERCLKKAPADRYESTRDLARDLSAVEEHRSRSTLAAVVCASCGAANPEGHRFCGGCGAELRRACASCGASNPVDVAFCGSCGAATPSSTSAGRPAPSRDGGSGSMAGERRQVTILVTRLPDYEALIEQASPEEVEQVLERLETTCGEVVDRFGGSIERAAPDTVVALFGTETAHEDDPLRAVRAALELRRLLEGCCGTSGDAEPCSAVHTGPVVVQGERGSAPRVVGKATNVAMTLARTAEAGQILLTPESRKLCGRAVASEPLEPIRLSSSGEPSIPHRVVGFEASSTPPLQSADAPLTPFAGRKGELGTLIGCVETALEGEGQFVTVVGEAGAGKSRLMYELRRHLDGMSVSLLEGRCQSHGERMPYLPLIQACRELLRFREEDPPEVQLGNVVESIRTIDPELETLLPLYLQLLSAPREEYPLPEHLEGKPFRHAMQEALAALFTLASRQRPVVLLLEDWHWVDEASHDVAHQLAEMCSEYPMLLAVSYRPDAAPDWGSPGRMRAVNLGALGPVSSSTIMRSVLGAERIPDGLVTLIHERTGGNPFYLEEVCRTLIEENTIRVDGDEVRIAGPLEKLQLPDSVQAVIRTRLDRIDPAARDLLRRASVIGREFSLRVLQHVVEDDANLDRLLGRLKERGLIRQARVLPQPLYRFQHVLTQEVAYDSLLRRQKKELHGLVGRALEKVHGDRLKEHYDELARHFAESENWSKAVQYGQLSAKRARGLSQFVDALSALGRTRSWLERMPESDATRERWIELLEEESRVCEVVGDRQRQQRALDDLLALLKDLGDRPELVRAHLQHAELMALARDFEGGEAALGLALETSRRLGDPDLERDVLRSLAFVLWQRERNDEALKALDQALAIDRSLGYTQRIVGDLSNRASVLRGLGRYEEALQSLQEALHHSEQPGSNPHRFVEALYVTYTIYRDLGRTEEGEPYLRRAMEVQGQDRFTIHQPFHISAVSNILIERGEIEQALGLLRAAVERSRQARYAFGLSRCQTDLAEALLGLGREDEALPHLLEAAEIFSRLNDQEAELSALAAAAPILERRGERSEAKRCWRRVRNAPENKMKVTALRGLSRIAEAEGEANRALDHLQVALRLCGDAASSLKGDLLNSVAILEWRGGAFEQALEHYREALTIFEELEDPIHTGLVLNSIGATLKKMERHEESRVALERALELHGRSGQDLLRGHALALLGDLAYEEHALDDARDRYRDSLELRRRLGDRRGEGWMHYQLARTCRASGQTDEADGHLGRAAKIAAEIDDGELADACSTLTDE